MMQNTGLNPKITFSHLRMYFIIALFRAILNWQIFANPENRGQVVFAY